MKRLRIGYWPISENLDAAGDRRRVVFWAKARGHVIVTERNKRVDIIVASEKSDFNSPYFTHRQVPLVFDLVDAYLSPRSNVEDLARGAVKKFSGQITGAIKPFSQHIEDFCKNSDAVICSSIEQVSLASKFQTNTHAILDCHDEIPFLDPRIHKREMSAVSRVFWEGQPATIKGVKKLSEILIGLSKEFEIGIYVIFPVKLVFFRGQ